MPPIGRNGGITRADRKWQTVVRKVRLQLRVVRMRHVRTVEPDPQRPWRLLQMESVLFQRNDQYVARVLELRLQGVEVGDDIATPPKVIKK